MVALVASLTPSILCHDRFSNVLPLTLSHVHVHVASEHHRVGDISTPWHRAAVSTERWRGGRTPLKGEGYSPVAQTPLRGHRLLPPPPLFQDPTGRYRAIATPIQSTRRHHLEALYPCPCLAPSLSLCVRAGPLPLPQVERSYDSMK